MGYVLMTIVEKGRISRMGIGDGGRAGDFPSDTRRHFFRGPFRLQCSRHP